MSSEKKIDRGEKVDSIQREEAFAEVRGVLADSRDAIGKKSHFWSLLRDVYLDNPQLYKEIWRPYLQAHWPESVIKIDNKSIDAMFEGGDVAVELVPFARFDVCVHSLERIQKLVSSSMMSLTHKLLIGSGLDASRVDACVDVLLDNPHTSGLQRLLLQPKLTTHAMERMVEADCFQALEALELLHEESCLYLAQSTNFPVLQELTVRGGEGGLRGYANVNVLLALMHSPHLPSLETLKLSSYVFRDTRIELQEDMFRDINTVILSGDVRSGIKSLDLSAISFDGGAFDVLFSTMCTPLLKELSFSSAYQFSSEMMVSLAECHSLSKLETLRLCKEYNHLDTGSLGRDGLIALATSSQLKNVSRWTFWYCHLNDELVELFASGFEGILHSLEIREGGFSTANQLTSISVNALIDAGLTKELEVLILPGHRIDSKGAIALANALSPGQLTQLNLQNNKIESEGVKALARSLSLSQHGVFEMSGNPIVLDAECGELMLAFVGVVDRFSLANHCRFHRKKGELLLGHCGLHTEDVVRLANMPLMKEINSLNLSSNAVGPEGAIALAQSPHLKNLQELTFSGNPIGPEGAHAILTSPSLKQVKLKMLNCSIGADAVLLALSSDNVGRLGPYGYDDGVTIFEEKDPITAGQCVDEEGFVRLVSSPLFRPFVGLDVSREAFGDEAALALASSPYAERLDFIRLRHPNVGVEGIKALVSSSMLKPLCALDVSGEKWTQDEIVAICSVPFRKNLERISLFDPEEVCSFAEALPFCFVPTLAHLRLEMYYEDFGDGLFIPIDEDTDDYACLEDLFERRGELLKGRLRVNWVQAQRIIDVIEFLDKYSSIQLVSLELHDAKIRQEGLLDVLRCEGLRHLKQLSYTPCECFKDEEPEEYNKLNGDELAKVIAKSTHFGELDTLSLELHVGEEGRMALAASPYLRDSVRVVWFVEE